MTGDCGEGGRIPSFYGIVFRAARTYIHSGYTRVRGMVKTTLFNSNRSQAVRLPKDVAFPEGVRSVVILRDGRRRVIVPADSVWDDFFDASGVDLGERDQPQAQDREAF